MPDRANSRSRIVLTALLVLSLIGGATAPSSAYPRPGQTEVISQLTLDERASAPLSELNIFDHIQGCAQGYGARADMTPDGRYVAFITVAALELDDTNLACDIYLRDRKTGDLRRVLAGDGSQPLPSSVITFSWSTMREPSLSANARYVTFSSSSPNLVGGDTNNQWDVFRYDFKSKEMVRVSVDSEDRQAENDGTCVLCRDLSSEPSISGTGRYIAFGSLAQLTPEDQDANDSDVFLRDVKSGTTTLLSDDPRAGNIQGPTISLNGKAVVYTARQRVVLVRDIESGKTIVASVLNDGADPNEFLDALTINGGVNGGRAISDDGRFVVFISGSPNFIPADSNETAFCRTQTIGQQGSMPDVFVRDLVKHRTERVSVSPSGEQAQWGGDGTDSHQLTTCFPRGGATISGDGRFVFFRSHTNFEGDEGSACPLPCTDPRGDPDLYLHDRKTGALTFASVAPDGADADCDSHQSTLSSSGRFGLLMSCATNLVDGDLNGMWDVFLRDFGPDTGLGGFEAPPQQGDPNEGICITPEICIPPEGAYFKRSNSNLDWALTEQGANLYGVSLAYRPQYEDLFASIELEQMPETSSVPSKMLYGLRFEIGDNRFEVRAVSLMGGTFGLFECGSIPGSICTKIAELRGGFGTTGQRVVFSLPLDEIGLTEGGELNQVQAFTALGTYLAGVTELLDTVSLSPN